MAHPKRKHSHSRTRKRRSQQKATMPLLVACTECKKLKPSHMICPFCGYYAGREIVKVEFKEKKRKIQ
ncbi:MAG: 50S ribosomal protein L32 [Candidatus Omnitrophica bacterium]|jgi:large subunit ribosomal protein L32|nr:50S ribosomal protein L32 [Candidatus Omnitrophota bacterium]MDD5080527.1 50S ribosomal protein L32 [Candidatus Omnitrophota bacterium]MDD5441542.1 50S ribosomal protein L32 [Candidatus Omnitrophota bacterium]